jgi:hypothetical protein
MFRLFAAVFLSVQVTQSPAVFGQDVNPRHHLSIKQVMQSVITPATNTLWETYEPESEEQWLELEQAAVTTVAAGTLTGLGGVAGTDMESVKEPEYQAFNRLMINAAIDALGAIAKRDVSAYQRAVDELYPPCEGCHLVYNPGVANQ